MVEPYTSLSEVHGFVLGATPGMEPRHSSEEAANRMIDTAQFLESMGYDAWQLRLMATRWRWGEPSRRQYDADVKWLQRQSSIAFRHMHGDRSTPLMEEPVEHFDRSRPELERPNSDSRLRHIAHASSRPPEYQLKVLERRWEAAVLRIGRPGPS